MNTGKKYEARMMVTLGFDDEKEAMEVMGGMAVAVRAIAAVEQLPGSVHCEIGQRVNVTAAPGGDREHNPELN